MCVASLRLVRNAVVALAGLLAVSVTSSAARGECGDYVIVGRPLLNPSDLSPELRIKFTIQSVYSHNEPTEHRGSIPCHGPGCSRRDPVPAPLGLAAVVTTSISDWAFLAAGIPLLEFGPERFYPLSNSPLPDRHPTPIEHPPRLV